jgi:cation:H+ antiporter
MVLQIIMFVTGLAGLIYGAEWLVTGSANIARRLGISQMVIGLTVVAIGTSTPELAVSILAAVGGQTDVAIGNIVGSNIANLGLILGLTALVRAIPVRRDTITKDIPVMIAAAIAAALFARDGSIGRGDGVLLLIATVAYLGLLLRSEMAPPAVSAEEIEVFDPLEDRPRISPVMDMLRIAAGIGTLVLGARFLVGSATYFAGLLGVSDLVIGLTVVAVGTSLPELATSFMAARRGHSDLALGNVIGSNILNILLIMGITAVIHPLPATASMLAFEIPVMLVISALLLPLALRGRKIDRLEGILLIAGYIAFVLILFQRGGV